MMIVITNQRNCTPKLPLQQTPGAAPSIGQTCWKTFWDQLHLKSKIHQLVYLLHPTTKKHSCQHSSSSALWSMHSGLHNNGTDFEPLSNTAYALCKADGLQPRKEGDGVDEQVIWQSMEVSLAHSNSNSTSKPMAHCALYWADQ